MSAHRILVLVNDHVTDDGLTDLVAGRACEVLVVAPALAGRLDYWAGDDRRSRREAEERLDRCLDTLGRRGLAARGWVGDADPLLAIADALSIFAADEIVVASRTETRGSRLTRDVAARARRRFDRPVHDLAA